jgi:hypothetical protein
MASVSDHGPTAEEDAAAVADTEREATAKEDAAAVADTEGEPVADTESEPVADTESEPVADTESEPVADTEGEPVPERGRERRGVSRLVTAGVVLVVIALAVAGGALYVTTHGFRPKTVVTYRPAAVYGLRAGECLNSSQNGLSVTILSCATPHEAEVFATFSLTGSSWPGDSAIQQQAGNGCTDRIGSYLNPQLLNAGLIQQYVYPNQDAWQAGVRTVVCEVSSASGPLSGSVRNGG